MAAKLKADPAHRMGNQTGYNILPNGNIKAAPLYREQMAECQVMTDAINELVAAHTKALLVITQSTVKQRRAIFNRMAEDYGLDLTRDNWNFNSETGEVYKVASPPMKEK
jgi:hypothetical protein